ncbi:hypothetical protein HYX70_01855 [Candidatus Saccharibacteria bacterium]|nr:hypothetical protein [Candidatus Saccharibacteria bacterium]
MNTQDKRSVALTGAMVAAGFVAYPNMRRGVALGARRWRNDWRATGFDILLSTSGQAFFWTLGQDFIGLSMRPKWLPGVGHVLARKLQPLMPQTASFAWTMKFAEIACDALKMPVEGRLYRQSGIIPDGWACLITQPGWSFIEVADKLAGVILCPELVNDHQQVEDSMSSIYGSVTRLALCSLFFSTFGSKSLERKRHPQKVFG